MMPNQHLADKIAGKANEHIHKPKSVITPTYADLKNEPKKKVAIKEEPIVHKISSEMNKLRVLHLALLNPNEPNDCMGLAFKKITLQHREIDWHKIFTQSDSKSFNELILQQAIMYKPDVVFMQLQLENVISDKTAKELSRRSFVINWTGDVRNDISWYWKLGENINLTLFTNETDVDTLRNKNVKSDYLQVGYDADFYIRYGVISHDVPEVVFLGNNYGKSTFQFSGERIEMIEFLKYTYGGRFKLYGAGWGEEVAHCSPYDERVVYNSCKIAINQNHYKHKRFSSDRMFRIMGCGAMCLTNYYEGIELDFENKKQLVWWKTFDELKELIDYYLNNDNERNAIAQRGYEHVRKYCTWEYRFGVELPKLIEKYK